MQPKKVAICIYPFLSSDSQFLGGKSKKKPEGDSNADPVSGENQSKSEEAPPQTEAAPTEQTGEQTAQEESKPAEQEPEAETPAEQSAVEEVKKEDDKPAEQAEEQAPAAEQPQQSEVSVTSQCQKQLARSFVGNIIVCFA